MNIQKFFLTILLGLFPLFTNAIVYLEEPEGFKLQAEVIGCFIEYKDKILLLHRQDRTTQGNLWGIPGGKLEPSETPIEAAIREVGEETGFDISKQSVTYLKKVYIKYPNFHYIYHMAKCSWRHPQDVKITFNEHKGFTWVTPEDALTMHLMLDEDTCIKLIYRDQEL